MHRILNDLALRQARKGKKHIPEKPKASDPELREALRRFRIAARRITMNSILIALGVLSAGFGLKGFLLPNGFIDGGAVGISLLISEVSDVSLSVLLVLINIPFIYFGLRTVGKEFALKTAIGIIALSLMVAYFPYPQITEDKLLVAVFGGFFLGAGIGLAVRGGGVIDGTEVLAINLSKPLGVSIGDIILVMNIAIFAVAAYLLSLEIALYSILTYLAASKTVDFLIDGIEQYTGVTIISTEAEEIRTMITEQLGRGVTIYKGERGFGKRGHQNRELDIIYTVITRLEISKLNAEIEKIDAEAFVVMHSIRDTKGGMIKKRAFKH
jgi:uncharacterized membrane-anchored protein YitT (DUF2179 family)